MHYPIFMTPYHHHVVVRKSEAPIWVILLAIVILLILAYLYFYGNPFVQPVNTNYRVYERTVSVPERDRVINSSNSTGYAGSTTSTSSTTQTTSYETVITP